MQKYSNSRLSHIHRLTQNIKSEYNFDHIDVFFMLFYPNFPMDEELKKKQLEKWFKLPLDTINFDVIKDYFLRYPPDNTQLVHYLKQKGYTPGHIASFLNVSKVTVSYHTSKELKAEYVNWRVMDYIGNVKHQRRPNDPDYI